MRIASWSLPLGSFAGTRIYIHFSFFLLLAWRAWEGWQQAGWENARFEVIFTVALFTCILAHEFGHILTAKYYNIRSPSVTLWPFGGVALLERTPAKAKEEFLITLAGPMVNVVIFCALYATLFMGEIPLILSVYKSYGYKTAYFLKMIMYVNVFIAVFNLIPAFPMDGGRILRSILSIFFGFIRATKIAAYLGQGIAILFFIAGFFESSMLSIIGVFIFTAARAELLFVQALEQRR